MPNYFHCLNFSPWRIIADNEMWHLQHLCQRETYHDKQFCNSGTWLKFYIVLSRPKSLTVYLITRSLRHSVLQLL